MAEKSDRRLVEDSVSVPKNVGRAGFLRTIEEIMKLQRVQSIHIDAKGLVEYKRYVLNGENDKLKVDFEELEPYSIIRNGSVDEVMASPTLGAAVIITSMLDMAGTDGLYPIAFVTGSNTILWGWYMKSTGFPLNYKESLCGLPLYFDRHAPDTALILCAAQTRTDVLVSTHKSYKVEMTIEGPETTVEVF